MGTFDLDDDLGLGESREDKLLERFEAHVDKKMRLLLTRKADPKERIEAAYWLGESGAPKAITALRKIYRGEKDPRIKKAAEYALGMFKALDIAIEREEGESVAEALGRDDNSAVRQLLEDIALKGAMGQRSSIKGFLTRLQVGLAGLLAVLVIANVAVMGTGGSSGDDPVATLTPSQMLLAEIRALATNARSDTLTLQAEFDAAAAAGPFDCAITFNLVNQPYSFAITPGQVAPNIEILANRTTAAVRRLNDTRTIFDSACAPDAIQPSSDRISQAQTDLAASLSEFDSILSAVAIAEQSLVPVEPTRTPEEIPTQEVTVEATEPAATPEPGVTPTATLDRVIVNRYVRDINFIISDVRSADGAYTLLNQFWTDVSVGGNTLGCRQPPPDIPEDYTLDAEIAAALPQLQTAVNNLNGIALTLLRQGWERFRTACANGTLAQEVGTGLILTQTVSDALTGAQAVVNQITSQ